MKRRIFSPREIILPKAKLARSAISWGKFVMPILLLAWFFVLGAEARAATLPIETDTVWTKAQSPIVVNDYIWLKAGINLIIEKGVIIKFNSSGMLIISGKLTAVGTKTEPIIFYFP